MDFSEIMNIILSGGLVGTCLLYTSAFGEEVVVLDKRSNPVFKASEKKISVDPASVTLEATGGSEEVLSLIHICGKSQLLFHINILRLSIPFLNRQNYRFGVRYTLVHHPQTVAGL